MATPSRWSLPPYGPTSGATLEEEAAEEEEEEEAAAAAAAAAAAEEKEEWVGNVSHFFFQRNV